MRSARARGAVSIRPRALVCPTGASSGRRAAWRCAGPLRMGVCQRGGAPDRPGSPLVAPRSLQAATGRRSHPGATARTAVTPHP